MDIFDTYPQGYWVVNGKKFLNKYQALLESRGTNKKPQWIYFDHVWENFDRSLLGKFSLQDLYLQNAKRLREKYDYLILYFSGGADSYNILRTFLDNNIKIDEICVKWASMALKSNVQVYNPNQTDVWCTNYISEWDFAIKPVLEEVAKTHPEINIEIVDWTNNLNVNLEKTFEIVNHWHDIEVPSLAVWSPNERKLTDQGKRVGSIYGIDKPLTWFNNGNSYMVFNDAAVTIATPNPANIQGTEMFYWTPEFPLLAFEMAHVTIKWLISDPVLFNSIAYYPEKEKNKYELDLAYQKQQRLMRNILYNNWTGRFQALKSETLDRVDKQAPLLRLPEFKKYKQEFDSLIKSSTTDIDNICLFKRGSSVSYSPCFSKHHLLRTN